MPRTFVVIMRHLLGKLSDSQVWRIFDGCPLGEAVIITLIIKSELVVIQYAGPEAIMVIKSNDSRSSAGIYLLFGVQEKNII